MFFVVNKTKKEIKIDDLGISLGPRQAIDLDKILHRDRINNSESLKLSKINGDIEVRVQDSDNSVKKEVDSQGDKLNTTSMIVDIENMKQDIIQEIKNIFSSQGNFVSKHDIMEIISSLSKMPAVQGAAVSESRGEDVSVDEGILSSISARAVNNIVKDTKIKSHYREERQNENNIANNISELENLID